MVNKNVFVLLTLITILLYGQICANGRDGIYIGAGVGAIFDHTQVTATNTINGFSVRKRKDTSHAIGNVFLGYGYTFSSCFFLGLEGGTYFPHRRVSITRPGVFFTTQNFNDELRARDYFTADVLPGFRLCPDVLIYARGGFTVAHLSLEQDAIPAAGAPGFENSFTKCGGRAGAGICYSFSEHLALAVDYVFSWYPRIAAEVSQFSTLVKAQRHANYVGVSLIYNFPICCNW